MKKLLLAALLTLGISTPAAAHHHRERCNDDSGTCCKTTFSPRFSATYDAGIGFTDQNPLDMSLTAGAQFTRAFYLGVGVNFTNWGLLNTDQFSRSDLSLIAHPRLTLPTRRSVTPYVDLKMGYSLAPGGRFFIAPGAGVKIRHFLVGLSYTSQETDILTRTYSGYSNDYRNLRLQGLSFRLGYTF